MRLRFVRRTMSAHRGTRATPRSRRGVALAFTISIAALGISACRLEKATDNAPPDLVGNFNLLTYNGANLPTVVIVALGYTETLLSARMELLGKTARDIKERRIEDGSGTRTIVDTVDLSVGRLDNATLLLRPSDAPTLQPDTAVVADGVVKEGILTVRTRNGPIQPAGVRATLVYGRQS